MVCFLHFDEVPGSVPSEDRHRSPSWLFQVVIALTSRNPLLSVSRQVSVTF